MTTTTNQGEVLTEMERLTEQRYIKQLYHIYRKPHLGYTSFSGTGTCRTGPGPRKRSEVLLQKKARWDALPLKRKHRCYNALFACRFSTENEKEDNRKICLQPAKLTWLAGTPIHPLTAVCSAN